MRDIPEELRRRYIADGHWNDDTFGIALERGLTEGAGLPFKVWSQIRPEDATLGSIHERARRLSTWLVGRGIRPGDVVSMQMPNWTEAAVAFWGSSMAGAIVVPIVHFYGAKEAGYILRESGARIHLTADRFGHHDFISINESLRDTLPDLEQVLVLRSGDRLDATLPSWATPFEVIDGCEPIESIVTTSPDQPGLIAYTSGTTSNPKGVIHTSRTMLSELRASSWMSRPDARPMVVGAPVSHAIGMMSGLLGPVIKTQPIYLTDVWDPAVVLSAMLEVDATSGSGATYFLTSLLDHPDFGPEHLAKMTTVGMGGSAIPNAVADRAESLGILMIRSYGSTEHPSVTGSEYSAPREKRLYTDGCPMPGVEVRLLDEDERPVAVGEPGEIWSRGPELCAGYTDAHLTAENFTVDGWYKTGDVGIADSDGYIAITDRKKDLIIRGGMNISPAEIEELILRMPGVADVAVVGKPDEKLGERGCAFVRSLPGQDAPTLDAVKAHLERSGLARQKWPEDVRAVTDDFPRTPSGKVKKYELRARLRAEAEGVAG